MPAVECGVHDSSPTIRRTEEKLGLTRRDLHSHRIYLGTLKHSCDCSKPTRDLRRAQKNIIMFACVVWPAEEDYHRRFPAKQPAAAFLAPRSFLRGGRRAFLPPSPGGWGGGGGGGGGGLGAGDGGFAYFEGVCTTIATITQEGAWKEDFAERISRREEDTRFIALSASHCGFHRSFATALGEEGHAGRASSGGR